MSDYTPQSASKEIELIFAREGHGRSGDIVPSQIGVPVATGLAKDAFIVETSKFFDEQPLDPAQAEQLIADLQA